MADDKSVSEDFAIEEGLQDLAATDEVEALKAERDGKVVWHEEWAMDAWGDARGTAMARLVSIRRRGSGGMWRAMAAMIRSPQCGLAGEVS